jgi:hypothetical protein
MRYIPVIRKFTVLKVPRTAFLHYINRIYSLRQEKAVLVKGVLYVCPIQTLFETVHEHCMFLAT